MKKPNIVLFLTDDQGSWALGCAGNPEIVTPNLDRLASEGMRFENYFCTSPVCSPARASLLTGRIPSQHGIHDWLASGNMPALPGGSPGGPGAVPPMLAPDLLVAGEKPIEYLAGMRGYTDILAENGYTCGISGKWHLGDSLNPQKGFSFWRVIPYGGSNYFNGGFIVDGKLARDPRYLTEVITEHALQFLETRRYDPEPFYLSVHYTAPHSPWDNGQHPPELTGLYRDTLFKSCPDLTQPHPWQINSAPRGTGERRLELLRGYFAAVTGVDRSVGQVLAKLDELGLRQDTLIIFSGDNGMNMGHHGIWGKGNGTFPLNMYDTSVKVPFILSFPGHIPQGVIDSHLLSHYDFMPTLLDYLGFPCPEANLPGMSFAPLLRGGGTSSSVDLSQPLDSGPGRDVAFDENEFLVVFDEYGPVRMIRSQEWKYVHRYPYGPHELYNLSNDPDETRNLIAEVAHRSVAESLKGELDAWFLKYVDPRIDGVREAVTGKGQIDRAGVYGVGRQAYENSLWHVDADGKKTNPISTSSETLPLEAL
jgi:choline-sulfatase